MAGRTWLLCLRLLAILLLLLGWLRPGLVSTVQRDSDAAVAVLIDASQSMTMPSGYDEKTRWTVAREAWDAIEREATDVGSARPAWCPTSLTSICELTYWAVERDCQLYGCDLESWSQREVDRLGRSAG